MNFSFPFTMYQLRQAKTCALIILSVLFFVLITGNIYSIFIKQGIRVDEKAWISVDGYPLFTSADDYIAFVKNYPHDPGVKIKIHKTAPGESLWDISRRYGIDIDTVIAANPFLTSLADVTCTELVIPLEKGVLFPFDSYFEVGRMAEDLHFRGEIRGEFRPRLFKLISNDDMRLVFFKDAKPVFVNSEIAVVYSFKNIFDPPVDGRYTSMYGNRKDPFLKMNAFHNGLDIQAKNGLPVQAAKKGIVSFSGWRNGYGQTVTVLHDGGYETVYAHCSKLIAKRGDIVEKNDTIALAGSTGRSTGPHVHFEIKHHGKIINPLNLIW